MNKPDFQILAQTQNEETKLLDFKSNFEPTKPGFWCEIVKDIVAFANGQGGVIVFGLDSDGKPTPGNCSDAAATDVAVISDQVTKYTGVSIGSLRKFQTKRDGLEYWCISCEPERILIPFTKPGTYEPVKGTQKTSFSIGQVYVRHGSKSEPMIRDDLRAWIDRELERVRTEWLTNIRKVVEAPVGQTVVVSTLVGGSDANIPAISARITNDPDAISVRLADPKVGWPYRGKDIIDEFHAAFPEVDFNPHDLVAIRHSHEINEMLRPEMMLKTHKNAGPQYSIAFRDWLIKQCRNDPAFLGKARLKWRADKYPN